MDGARVPVCLSVRFERYADDIIANRVSKRQADYVLAAMSKRMGAVGLRLHPDKTFHPPISTRGLAASARRGRAVA